MLDLHPADAPLPSYPLWLYQAVHTGNPGDAAYYVEHCRGAKRILEIGCGAGRIADDLRRAGLGSVGIDCNPEAVAACVGRGLRAKVMDMRSLAFAERFDRIIAPYNVLYCALTEADFLAVLKRVRVCLEPTGEFIFDIYCADALSEGLDLASVDPQAAPLVEIEELPIMEVEALGRRWDVFDDSYWWPHLQRIDAYFRHVAKDDGETIVVNIPQRYLLSGELAGLLGEAGFALRSFDGDFHGTPFGPGAELMVVRAVLAPD